jgi:hypothetical protein
MDDGGTGTRHRAIYTLEMGVWRATCRACGHSETDPSRRRAASVFRNHIRNASNASEIELRNEPFDADASADGREGDPSEQAQLLG